MVMKIILLRYEEKKITLNFLKKFFLQSKFQKWTFIFVQFSKWILKSEKNLKIVCYDNGLIFKK